MIARRIKKNFDINFVFDINLISIAYANFIFRNILKNVQFKENE